MKKIRLRIKNILSKYFLLNEYCKRCGKRNRYTWFDAENNTWENVTHMEDKCNVLCWGCFNKMAIKKHIDLKVYKVK